MSELTGVPTDETHKSAGLLLLKEYKQGSLTHVSEKAYDMLLQVEAMFRGTQSTLMQQENVKARLVEQATLHTEAFQLPTCHNVKHKLITKFIGARLHFYCKMENAKLKKNMKKSKSGGELGSKTMAMRKLAKNVK